MFPLSGTLHAVVLQVTPVSIHGDLYFDLLIQTPEDQAENKAKQVRVPLHALSDGRPPAPGERVEIQVLMQQVTGIRRIA